MTFYYSQCFSGSLNETSTHLFFNQGHCNFFLKGTHKIFSMNSCIAKELDNLYGNVDKENKI